jgi:hypothetical protein
MVREGEPPTTLQRETGAKEVVDSLPSQTMTARFLVTEDKEADAGTATSKNKV